MEPNVKVIAILTCVKYRINVTCTVATNRRMDIIVLEKVE